jgi:hypothetical protein
MEVSVKSLITRATALTGALGLALLPAAALALPTNSAAVTAGIGYLNTQQQATGEISGFPGISQWAAMAYVAAGTDLDTVKITGGTSLLDYLQATPPTAGASANDWSRGILAVVAAGQNPYSFGTDYVAGLKTKHTADQIGSATAVNDDMFGILALVAAKVAPTDEALTDALAVVLANQRSDGGWSYSTDTAVGADVDDTAVAVMALVAAEDAGLTVPAGVIDDALAFMLANQVAGGGFQSDAVMMPGANVGSSAWALMALTAIGEDDSPEGIEVQEYLRSTQNSDGSFPWMAPSAGDTYDTSQAVIALAGDTWPQAIFAGQVPAVSPTPSASPSQSASPSPSPSQSTRVSPSPSGQVLGATATPSPSASGQVQGASVLPRVGAPAGIATLLLAFVIIAATALAIRAGRKA